MRALDIKLLRDLRRLWAQALAIALVIAGGVATLILAVGSYRSLDETRAAYYERYRFADVFAAVRRAPKTLVDQIAEIPGVAAVDARIAKLALLDIPNYSGAGDRPIHFAARRPASPRSIGSICGSGRMPEPGRADEVVVNENFAKAHGFSSGSRFSAILNGRKRELVDRRDRAVARVYLRGRAGRHHAGRPPLRRHLDVRKVARQRLRSRRRFLVRRSSNCCGMRPSAT